MKNKKSEAIIVRSRGGNLEEFRLIPNFHKQGNARFSTDGMIMGSMETKTLPERYNSLLKWLDDNGRLDQVEQMIKFIFK